MRNLTNIVKQEILSELKKGNTEVLKGLPPVLALQYGLAMQNETNYKEQSPIKDESLNEAMLNRLKNSGVKEELIKKINEGKEVTS